MMLEFFKDAFDKNKTFGMLLTDLSCFFRFVDCVRHDLLIAKLHAYARIIYQTVSKEPKKTPFLVPGRIFLSGVPQDSILDPPLFNIFMCDIFLTFKTVNFTSYADDNTPFVVTDNMEDVVRSLEEIGENLITWFSDNQTKFNLNNVTSF